MTAQVREAAPAKVNLVLHVGERSASGLHEVCSLFASIDLADEVVVEEAAGGADSVHAAGVPGPNLAAAALAAFRAAVPDAGLPPLSVSIEKRIPVAAGLGGGSADAAATLRAGNALAGGPLDLPGLRRIAAGLGSDVPSQIEPRHALVTGTGEGVEPVELPELALVLLSTEPGLATGDVYAELDRLGRHRERLEPERLRALARSDASTEELAAALENDLEPAALSLRPELKGSLSALRDAGAVAVRVCGSGPTAFGLFDTPQAADAAAGSLDAAIVTRGRS